MSIIASDFIDLESVHQPLAAVLKNDCHGHQGANLQWPNMHFCSQDINQHICQIWCLYHKMNNWFGMLNYAAPLKYILLKMVKITTQVLLFKCKNIYYKHILNR